MPVLNGELALRIRGRSTIPVALWQGVRQCTRAPPHDKRYRPFRRFVLSQKPSPASFSRAKPTSLFSLTLLLAGLFLATIDSVVTSTGMRIGLTMPHPSWNSAQKIRERTYDSRASPMGTSGARSGGSCSQRAFNRATRIRSCLASLSVSESHPMGSKRETGPLVVTECTTGALSARPPELKSQKDKHCILLCGMERSAAWVPVP